METRGQTVRVVGAGLAGSECAFQLAKQGFSVVLHEMRPEIMTPAHKTAKAAELVCSNSFGSQAETSAPGQLKWEAEQLGSIILKSAKAFSVPAGQALGIDRERFSEEVTRVLKAEPNITFSSACIEDISQLPRPAVIATGPLTAEFLSHSIHNHFSNEFLYFFDAIAPVIDADTIDMSKAWKQSRWDKGEADYINCPMNKEQYYAFIEEVEKAEKVEPKEFEKDTPFFEGCMPIEEMVRRGKETLRFGPMKPVGLTNPHNSTERAYAIVQLRMDNKEATAYNIVGFQTKMKYPEQKRIFKMIPGLENADFLKLGSIHRNMYVNSPKVLNKNLSSKKDPLLFFAGQITGVEGYFESACIGLLVARFVEQALAKKPLNVPPRLSAMGSLHQAITEEKEDFQPTNINFGLFPAIEARMPKDKKRELILAKAKQAFLEWQDENKSLAKGLAQEAVATNSPN